MIILGTNSVKDSGYTVDNSCRFNDGDSPYMHKTPGSASGTRTKFTFNCWFKRGVLGTEQNLIEAGTSSNERTYLSLGVFGTNELSFVHRTGGSNSIVVTGTNLLRDVSAWYMITVKYDSTQGSANDRVRLYINGTEVAYTTQTMPGSNDTTYINDDEIHYISRANHAGERYLDGYLAEVCLIDASALTPSSFSEFDEDTPTVLKPKDVSGLTFGTNGFYLDFEDSSNLGNDANGGTDLTESGLAAVDQATDTPTNNFATLNAVNKYYDISTLSNGNTTYDGNSTSGNYTYTPATIGFNKGKWYWEVLMGSGNASNWYGIGIVSANSTGLVNFMGEEANSYGYYGRTLSGGLGVTYNNNTQLNQALPYTEGDIMMCAVDCDNLAIYWGKNGTWLDNSSSVTGVPTSGASKTGTMFSITAPSSTTDGFYYPAACNFDTPAYIQNYNFGSPPYAISSGNADANGYGNFEYAPPSGFYALCTKNLAEYG